MTETTRRAPLPPNMPRAIRNLPRDSVGRPVPFFVQYVDGVPDFRIMNAGHFRQALTGHLCWVCGGPLRQERGAGRWPATFVAGPMCLVNGTSAEPPCHAECADWSARACPFLSQPKKGRREAGLPTDWAEAAGISLTRNPGVTALIATSHYRPMRVPAELGKAGFLVHFEQPTAVTWLCEGREANAEEIAHSIDTGLPDLYAMAEDEGPEAVAALEAKLAAARRWIPDAWSAPVPRQRIP